MLDPHFPSSGTKTRCLEDTKIAVALPRCSESTKESIAGWWTFRLEVTLEFWGNYGTSYVQKTGVEVLPVGDLSETIGLFFLFVGDATKVPRQKRKKCIPRSTILCTINGMETR